ERADLAAIHKINGNGALIGIAGIMGDLFAIGHAQGVAPEQVLELIKAFPVGRSLPGIAQRVLGAPGMAASFEMTMARKDLGLMVDAAGGRENLVCLPGLADSMDDRIAEGKGKHDFANFAWPNRD
ncbi:MAG: 3-hydroxyisobutyrate dehydrogenase, partial [Kiritimatiellia bacterium]